MGNNEEKRFGASFRNAAALAICTALTSYSEKAAGADKLKHVTGSTTTVAIAVELPAGCAKQPVARLDDGYPPPMCGESTKVPPSVLAKLNTIPASDFGSLCLSSSCLGTHALLDVDTAAERFAQAHEILALSARLFRQGITQDPIPTYIHNTKVIMIDVPVDAGLSFGGQLVNIPSRQASDIVCADVITSTNCTLTIDMLPQSVKNSGTDAIAYYNYEQLNEYAEADAILALAERVYEQAQNAPTAPNHPVITYPPPPP